MTPIRVVWENLDGVFSVAQDCALSASHRRRRRRRRHLVQNLTPLEFSIHSFLGHKIEVVYVVVES